MRVKHTFSFLLFLCVTIVPLLACSIGMAKDASTPTPVVIMPPAVTPNATAAARAKKNFNQVMQEAKGGREVQFHITPEELTSLVVDVLNERGDIPFSNPQIWFAESDIYVRGDVQNFGTAQIILHPTVDDSHQVQVELVEAKVGAFSIPSAITENITATANESVREMPFNIRVSAVDVRSDEIIITFSRTD